MNNVCLALFSFIFSFVQLFSQSAISTADPLATQVGINILNSGGNAADAAVAVGFTLAVVYPSAGNIGGGGVAVTYRNGESTAFALDFREVAPAAATENMFLDDDGNVIPERSTVGHLSIGVPGTVAGLWELHQKLGCLPWKDLLSPAICLAEKGFIVSHKLAEEFAHSTDQLRRYRSTAETFLKKDGTTYEAGELFQQPALAKTLHLIAEQGPDGFYRGSVAKAIVSEIGSGGGVMTEEDLAHYKAKWRDVVTFNYRGHTVWSMPPPSSGGIVLGMMLQILSNWETDEVDLDSAQGLHRYIETARRAYADRATHLGDTDFWDVPQRRLLSEWYAKEQFKTIKDTATLSHSVQAGRCPIQESEDTTHYSILDGCGLAVSVTTTLNFSYGSLVTVSDGGFLLNNEMDDFSIKPGAPNAYGLIGGYANAIKPKKRMLSSMTPTIVTQNGNIVLVLGTPGGSTIITTVLQVISRILDKKQSLKEAVEASRVHHQWLPDLVIYEKERSLSPDLIQGLKQRGHILLERDLIGDVTAIHVKPSATDAVADSRRRGEARVINSDCDPIKLVRYF